MSLTSRIRARFNHLFPPPPKPPTPGPKPPGSSFDSTAKLRRRIVVNPIHPDFLERVDPLWPIPEEALKKNEPVENAVSRRLHPHTAFGRSGFGIVTIPETIATPIRFLVEGMSSRRY
jgi:hypothetical protein